MLLLASSICMAFTMFDIKRYKKKGETDRGDCEGAEESEVEQSSAHGSCKLSFVRQQSLHLF